jgi:hypothetical protein
LILISIHTAQVGAFFERKTVPLFVLFYACI